MPHVNDPRVRHAASHKVGAVDAISPKDVGAAAVPQIVSKSAVTALDTTYGLANQAIVPLLVFHTATAPAGNSVTATTTFTYSDATTTVVTATVGAATSQTFFATWDVAINDAVYNVVSSEKTFPWTTEGATPTGNTLVTIRIQVTGTGATSTHDIRFIQI